MSTLRKDPITGRWVIFIEDRRRRNRHLPHQYQEAQEDKECPFCEGKEHLTPPEILAFRKENTQPNMAGWTLRIIPDRFPILKVEEKFESKGIGMYDIMNGLGAHEIVVENNVHSATYETLPIKKIMDIFWAYQQRINDLKKDVRMKYILVSKNFGTKAGALMPLLHPHSHLITYSFIPYVPQLECDGAKAYWDFHNRCIYCDMVSQELDSPNERIIYSNDEFIAISPFASRFPYEMWIIPVKHNYIFSGDDKLFESLAIVLKELIIRMNAVLFIPPYNLVIHSAPLSEEFSNYYHWHIEVRPRISQTAGFEWGSGTYINAVFPEIATQELKQIDVKSLFEY